MTQWFHAVRGDLTGAVRSLRRAPGLAATVLVVLGAAIGLNATLFTVIAGIAWRPWSGVSRPDTLVRIYARDAAGRVTGLSMADARAVAEVSASLLDVGAMRGDAVHIETDGGSRSARALLVTGNLMELLGVSPRLGRRIIPDDDRPGSPTPVAMLAHATWQSWFRGDPGIVGSVRRINGRPFTIVGIVSPAFESTEAAYGVEVYLAAGAVVLLKPGEDDARRVLTDPRACCADVVGRLSPGATRTQAAIELDVLARAWTSVSGSAPRAAVVTDTTFMSQPGRGDSAQALVTVTLLVGGLALVWLMACANIGNLLLAHTLGRVREIGTRAALGASRGHLLRLLLAEGAVLGTLAAAVGITVAWQLPPLLFRLVTDGSTRVQFPFPVTPDASVLTYVVCIGLASALVCSLAPALVVIRVAMKRGMTPALDAGLHRLRLRSVLLGVQVAVSIVLLAGAGLLARGAQRGAASFDPGFSVNGVTTVSFVLPERTYDRARATALFSAVAEGVRQQGSEYAFASRDPFSMYSEGTLIRLPGDPVDQPREALYLDVSPGYLGLLEIPIRAGRDFGAADTGQPMVIVNEAMARALWRDRDAVGQSFVMRRRGPAGEQVPQEVIGVARNVPATARPMFYRPIAPGTEVLDFISQDPRASQAPVLLIKGPPQSAAPVAVMASGIDSRIQVTLTPLADALARARASMKWGPLLAGALGLFAIALASVGMFGVFAYAVQQRTREIGVRIAIGAPPAAIVRLILAGHSRAVVIGVIAGLAGALASSVVLRAKLFGLSPLDPVTYAGVGVLLICCALAATYVPVRRATRVSAAVALRSD
jgi:putative ABC transport system permease protein